MGIGVKLLTKWRVPPLDVNQGEDVEPDPDDLPGEPATDRPRMIMTSSQLEDIRADILADPVYRARWQTAITQFESLGGYWQLGASGDGTRSGGTDWRNPGNTAFGAILASIRKSDDPADDLGLTWGYTWEEYKDRCIDRAVTWANDQDLVGQKDYPLFVALIYDLLYNHISTTDRQDIVSYLDFHFLFLKYCSGRWDDQTSWEHVSKVACGLATDNVTSRVGEMLANTQNWAEARTWMALNSISYEWKQAYPANLGQIFCLYMLKNYGGYTAAATTDKYLYYLQDTWQFVYQYVIPHPGRRPGMQARNNMLAPVVWPWVDLNVAGLLLWQRAFLPGKTELSALSDSRGVAGGPVANQPMLANSEDDYFGYAHYYWLDSAQTGVTFPNVLNYKWVNRGSAEPSKSHLPGFLSTVPWLLMNVQLPATAISPVDAGIPKVRRWWPGTQDLTTIRSGFTISNSSDTLISYWHKRYWITGYEGSTRQNGRWEVHRAGPLLVQRGSASHGVGSRAATWAANGCMTFIDENLYPLYHSTNYLMDDVDAGGCRLGPTNYETKEQVLAGGEGAEMGQVTAWYADADIVAISSNLTKSYNSTLYASNKPGNDPKISSFTREFVCIQRNADGTDHEKVFTYDRIQLTETRFVPKYNLCPATNPDIDGTETANANWAPQGESPAVIIGQQTITDSWFASGPTRWDYASATRLIYDNVDEPENGQKGHTAPGNGKVCVTWLRPSGADVTVTKRGGTNAYRLEAGPGNNHADGGPLFTPWGGWTGVDGEWNKWNNTGYRAYAGLYTVEVYPTTVSSTDQRFLMACEVMAATDDPGTAAELTCDSASVAAQCGATVVVFAKDGPRNSGFVDIPDGVTLVVVVNRPNGIRKIATTEATRVNF